LQAEKEAFEEAENLPDQDVALLCFSVKEMQILSL
jgi:hypothetical protein